ncbi:unnamed protein product [Urochloa humidicola]
MPPELAATPLPGVRLVPAPEVHPAVVPGARRAAVPAQGFAHDSHVRGELGSAHTAWEIEDEFHSFGVLRRRMNWNHSPAHQISLTQCNQVSTFAIEVVSPFSSLGMNPFPSASALQKMFGEKPSSESKLDFLHTKLNKLLRKYCCQNPLLISSDDGGLFPLIRFNCTVSCMGVNCQTHYRNFFQVLALHLGWE